MQVSSLIVSIPDRDSNRFQPTSVSEEKSILFQSLIGILIDFNLKLFHPILKLNVSIPDRNSNRFQLLVNAHRKSCRRLFQSLIGILIDFNHQLPPGTRPKPWFQSLIGILIDFNLLEFPRGMKVLLVSIPDRDSNRFQLGWCRRTRGQHPEFQSLIGILIDFN